MVALAVFQWDEPKIRIAMLGGTLMYLLGVVDDLKNLPAIVKLIGQTVIAILMFSMNMRISFIANYLGEGRLHFNPLVQGLSKRFQVRLHRPVPVYKLFECIPRPC